MPTCKTLIIHAGGGKTGSSALQNYLASHKNELSERGFSYENSAPISTGFEITSGNGLALLTLLHREFVSAVELDACIRSYFGDLDKAIVSSEMFEYLRPEGWRMLLDHCTALDIHAEVVFFVRNVGSFFASGYDQVIKRHGEWRSIDEWIRSSRWPHFDTLKRLSAFSDELPIKVFSYDAERARMIKCFLDFIGITVELNPISNAVAERRVNRSLTAHERDCLRMVNSRFGDSYSQDLSDRFIYALPRLSATPEPLSADAIVYLREAYLSAVDWINETYFDGKAAVAILADEVFQKQAAADQISSHTETDRIFHSWLLDKLEDKHHFAMTTVCNRLRNIDWERAGRSHLPDDFDPFAYLIKNPDVLNKGELPYEHYLEYGRHEGREYSWTNFELQL